MARTYTTRTILDGGQLKEEDYNSEVLGSLQEFNGQLDQHQLPLAEITHVHLQDARKVTRYIYADGTYSSYMTTQSYHQSEWEQGELPTVIIEADNELYYGAAWIRLSDIQIQTTGVTRGAQITFDNALEGMIVGNAVIDFTYFPGEAEGITQGEGDITIRSSECYGLDNPIEFGVFINDVLVARSGKIFPRRYTLDLPFSAPCSSGPQVIDIRFLPDFVDTGVFEPTLFTTYDLYTPQSLTYNGGNLWARNQYR